MHVKPLRLNRRDVFLGSGLIDHSQKTAAAMQIADMEVWAHRHVRRGSREVTSRRRNPFLMTKAIPLNTPGHQPWECHETKVNTV
jgi:hypothetical protein